MSGLDDSFTENSFGDLSYTFLEPVPNYLTCIICYCLLKKAVATDCCGKMLCDEHFPHTNRICPACRHTPLAVTRNKGIDNIVNDLKVFCLLREEGCQWEGHLCFEPNHRNTTCEYEVVSCTNSCGTDMQRRNMESHLVEDCPQREIKCEFCETVVTANELESHQESCPDYPLGCPHGCEVTLPRKEVEEHSTMCPEMTVPCPFAGAGCKGLVKNKDLADHVQVSVVEHLSLISAQNISLHDGQETLKQVQKNLQGELLQVTAENASLREELKTLRRDHAAMKQKNLDYQCQLHVMEARVDELSRDLRSTATQSKDLGGSVAHLKQSTESFWRSYLAQVSAISSDNLPIIYKYDDFQEDLDHDQSTYTPSFYTADSGYNLCLVTFPNGLKVEGWMSVTAIILPGDHDDELSWPNAGSLKVEILNQLGDFGHFSREIDFVRFPRKWKQRAHHDRRDDDCDGWGILKFISHHDLLVEVDGHRYVVDGVIYLRITRSA